MLILTGFLPEASLCNKLNHAFTDLLNNKASNDYLVDVKQADIAEIKKINQQYRQTNSATDVLSFPLFESVDALPNHNATIGDLVICPKMAGGDHLDLNECYIHGILHLLGYDHEKDKLVWNEARKKIRLNN